MRVSAGSTVRGQTAARLRLVRAQRAEGVRSLPAELNAFVGRERELSRLRDLQSQTRLLTLAGPGGVGKTRLAVRLGTELNDRFVEEARWVDLSQVVDATLVPQAFGDALGVQEPGDSWAGELTRVLHTRQVLLVVDNCEHVTAACADLLEHLLRACPNVALLATSRQPLGVAGETTWRVAPLDVPPHSPQTLETLAASEAVQLFVTRVQAHLPEFSVDAHNADAIAYICRLLDGLPLALELVAARVEGLGLAEVAARLSRGFDVASGASSTLPPRQQTLRAALDWSWNLLDEPEQVLLRRTGIFAGGWTLQAAMAVCAGDRPLSEQATVDALTNLVDKSLVIAEHRGNTVRYRLLETVRTYAREQLAEADETAAMQAQHAAFVLELAQRTPIEAIDAAQAALLIPEEDNVRAVLEWAVQCDQAQAGMRLAFGAYPMWMFTGHYTEGAGWCDRLLGLPSAEAFPAERCLALGHAGQLRLMLGDYDLAQSYGQAALELAREPEDALTVALLLEMLGNVALQRGDLAQAEALHADSARRKRELGSPRLVSNLLQLGLIGCERGDFAFVRELIAEVEAFAEGRKRPLIRAGALHLRGIVAAGEGATTTAARLFEQALELRRPAHDQQGVVKTLTSLGHVRVDLGAIGLAIEAFGEAVQLARASGERVRVIRALEGIARCFGSSNCDAAVRLAGACDAQRGVLGTLRWPTEKAFLDKWLAGARQMMGETAYRHAREDGLASSLAQAVSLAEALTVAAPAFSAGQGGEELSRREREVAALLGHGLTNKQIAAELVVSPATVRSHVEHILTKLDLRSRAQIAVWASQQGLLR